MSNVYQLLNQLVKMSFVFCLALACLGVSGSMAQEEQQEAQPEQQLRENDTVVFLGDSITKGGVRPGGYIDLASEAVEAAYPEMNIRLIGAGVGGHKVSNCLGRLERDVLKREPDVVVIYIGINDVWHWTLPNVIERGDRGTTPEEFRAGLVSMIQQINDVGARVILCTPTVIGEKHDGSNRMDEMLEQFAGISRDVAEESGAQLLDLRAAFLEYLAEHNPENVDRGILTRDSVHLNGKGNAFLSGLMLKALNVPVGENKEDADKAAKPAK